MHDDIRKQMIVIACMSHVLAKRFVASNLHAPLMHNLCCSGVSVSRESLTWPRGWRSGSMSWLAMRPELEEDDSGGTVVEPPLQRRRLDTSPAIAASGNEERRRDPATDWPRNHGASEPPEVPLMS